MAGFSGNNALLAVSKQSTKGTYAASIQYVTKFTGGSIDFDRQFARFDETSGTRDVGATYIQQVNIKGDPSVYLRPTDAVTWLEAVLGTRNTTGAGPFVHTLTPTEGNLPYLTIWQSLGGSAVTTSPTLSIQGKDCVIDTAKISGGVGQPIELAMGIMGLTGQRITASYPGAPTSETPYVFPQVSVTKGGSGVSSVNSFELNIENNHVLQQGNGAIAAYDVAPGERRVAGSMTMLWESVADYAKFHTGTGAGTAPSATPYTEALVLTCTSGATSISFTMNNVVYTAYDVSPDKGGAPIVANINFEAEPIATPVITAVVTNATASAAYNGV